MHSILHTFELKLLKYVVLCIEDRREIKKNEKTDTNLDILQEH